MKLERRIIFFDRSFSHESRSEPQNEFLKFVSSVEEEETHMTLRVSLSLMATRVMFN